MSKIQLEKNSIVFVTYQFKIGGVESVFLNIANILKDKKIYLVPLMENFDSELIDSLPKNVTLLSVKRKRWMIYNLSQLAFHLNKKYDFSHSIVVNFSDTLSTLFLSNMLRGKENISWVHCNPDALLNSKSFFLYKFFLSNNQRVVCTCIQQREVLLSLIPFLDKKIVICANVLEHQKILMKSSEPLEDFRKYILMVSRFDLRSKDFITLINAYSSLPIELKNEYKLVFVGDGPDFNYVSEYVNNSIDNLNIFLVGKELNPFKWMANATIFVHSSLSEGFSLVLLEAMVTGAPVVSANCNVGPSDILANGKYGFLFKPKDEVELKDKLLALLNNDDLLYEYSLLSARRALEIQLEAESKLRDLFHE